MGNPFVYVQLHSTDPKAAKDFYGTLFDWNFSEAPPGMPEYTEIDVGEGTAGGVMKCLSEDIPSHWLPYIVVEDISETARQADDLGAVILVAPTEVPGKGTYCVLKDPTGAVVALWQLLSQG